jgi:hypothetical protein
MTRDHKHSIHLAVWVGGCAVVGLLLWGPSLRSSGPAIVVAHHPAVSKSEDYDPEIKLPVAGEARNGAEASPGASNSPFVIRPEEIKPELPK